MKITIAVIVSADGYIVSEREHIEASCKQALSRLRKDADVELHPNASLLMLLAEKQNNENISYFAELTTDTLDLIKGLQGYGLIDEVSIHETKEICGSGIRLCDVPDME